MTNVRSGLREERQRLTQEGDASVGRCACTLLQLDGDGAAGRIRPCDGQRLPSSNLEAAVGDVYGIVAVVGLSRDKGDERQDGRCKLHVEC